MHVILQTDRFVYNSDTKHILTHWMEKVNKVLLKEGLKPAMGVTKTISFVPLLFRVFRISTYLLPDQAA